MFRPITLLVPAGSISKIALVAFSLRGRWAPVRAQAILSRGRHWVRLFKSTGMLERVREWAQLQSWPVALFGPIGWLEMVVLDVILGSNGVLWFVL